MSLILLLDENLRDRRLWHAIREHNAQGKEPLDVVRVGDEDGPPLRMGDDELLAWAAREGRILVAGDRSTLPAHLKRFCEDGNLSPGIIFPRRDLPVYDLLELLVLVANVTSSDEWANTYRWIP